MKKLFTGVTGLIVWIATVSVIFYNNAFQLLSTLQENKDLLIAFGIIVVSFTIYGIKNRSKIIRW